MPYDVIPHPWCTVAIIKQVAQYKKTRGAIFPADWLLILRGQTAVSQKIVPYVQGAMFEATNPGGSRSSSPVRSARSFRFAWVGDDDGSRLVGVAAVAIAPRRLARRSEIPGK